MNLCFITEALHKYRAYNNALPQRIVVYRDGVGEGQITYVYHHEVVLVEVNTIYLMTNYLKNSCWNLYTVLKCLYLLFGCMPIM